MNPMIVVRRLLLSLAAAAALLGAIANGATSEQTAPSAGTSKPMPLQEMVAGLIVKPRALIGAGLAYQLQIRDTGGLEKAAIAGMKVARRMSGDAHVLRLDQPVSLPAARMIAARLMRDDRVEWAEPDRVMYPMLTPSVAINPGYASQWHYFAPVAGNLGGANLPAAWDVTLGSETITVAVLDTGYRPHADLAAVLPGYDFVTRSFEANDGDGRDTNAQDPGDWVASNECPDGRQADSSWHGTHVAGTIAALMDNGIDGTGIAPNVKILPVRVMGKCGGFISDIVDGMRWAAGLLTISGRANPNPADVLNLSLGSSGACTATFQAAVTAVVAAGKVVVVAAGNSATAMGNSVSASQPANCAGVIGVTAHVVDGDHADYASFGTHTVLSAPGGGCGFLARDCAAFAALGIFSLGNKSATSPGADNFGAKNGTSMAAAHVSGVAALMLSVNPALTPSQIKSYLQSSARPHPVNTRCAQDRHRGLCGEGLLDARAAVTAARELPPLPGLVQSYQVVAPGQAVSLAANPAVAPGTARTIAGKLWSQQSGAPVAITDAATAHAAFTAPASGVYSFSLAVTDDDGKVGVAAATVRVNSAPALSAVGSQQVIAGQTLNFSVDATDIDGDALTFHSILLPPGASLSPAGVFGWASATPVGTHTLTYFASDGGDNSLQGNVTITVAAGQGGGGGMDGKSLIGLALLAVSLRLRRPDARRQAR